MKLVIAEKPSVAMALAAVLGADEKKDGYLEGGGYLVSWCVGHLLELAQPEAYGEQYARWRYGDLPILPDEWKYEVPKDKKKQLAAKRRELSKAKKRIAEIDALIQKIYEDNASGKLSDERYATLSLSYEEEQKTLKAAVPEMQAYLEAETDKTESLQRFIQKVKQITELKALTPELIHEFVDRIVVYAPRYLDGKRVQLLDIYYSGVGILHELTPEEMEEAFQHHLTERNKEKTA